MKVVIGKSLVPSSRINVIVIEVEFMHGDADDYSKEEIVFQYDLDTRDESKRVLPHLGITFEQAIELLDRMEKIEHNGHPKTMMEMFHTLPNFDELLGYDYPRDKFTDGQYYAAFSGYKVKYYDLVGIPHEVTIDRNS